MSYVGARERSDLVAQGLAALLALLGSGPLTCPTTPGVVEPR